VRTAADWRLAIAAGAAAGLAASPFASPGGGWQRPVLATVLAATALVERGRLRWPALALVFLAAALAGLLAGGARLDAIDGGSMHSAPGFVTLSGFVAESPSSSRGVTRFALETGRGRLLVESSHSQATGLTPGNGIVVSGRTAEPADWMRGDLEADGISTVLRAVRIRSAGNGRGGLAGFLDRLRDRGIASLGVAVPEREAALSRGFVLGDESSIDQRTRDDFRRSGLGHLLAVSGQNVVLLALLASPFLSLFGLGPRVRLLAVALLILLYIPLAGGGPSIQRAGVMGIASLAALGASRAPSRAYALAAAALVTLIINPRATADVGWQLSFAAVIGIILLARPLARRIEPLVGDTGWQKSLVEGVSVTASATIVTLPLVAFHFGQVPVAGLPANLVAMPAVAPAMWMGMISIAVGQLDPVLAAPFNLAGSLCLAWIAQVAEWFGRPEGATLKSPLESPGSLALLTVLAGMLVAGILWLWKPASGQVPVARRLPALALALTLLALPAAVLAGGGRRELAEPPAGGVRVEVIDVGQGDAILIRPYGSDPILIDGGPPGGDLAGALESAGVERLAAVLLTHPHLDHYGGLTEILGSMDVERLLFDLAPPGLISQARESGAGIVRVAAGDLIRDGNSTLEILWPPVREQQPLGAGPGPGPGSLQDESNQRSIVALLKWRGFRMLMPGDAEAESVPIDPGPIDVLKVSHHGSEDSGLAGLLARGRPALAIVSAGTGNDYGHPVPETLRTLGSTGAEVLRTDRDGTVSVVLGAGRAEIETGH